MTPQHCCDAMGAPADQSQGSARVHSGAQLVRAAGVKCMCTRRVKYGRKLKTMNVKNMNKSPIHENADANISCDFGDGDISCSRSRLPHTRPATHTHTRPNTSLARLYLDTTHQLILLKSIHLHRFHLDSVCLDFYINLNPHFSRQIF